ncbi:MAG: DEAD/DEAH box helicase [Defluviitaleaceae bacterium]|nr:DEAD/DEAH box helicase [Defluviitaleaceae bacterium]
MEFKDILNQNLLEKLSQKNIKKPMEIQSKAISRILDGEDVIVHSPTGSGKTLTYLLPIFQKLDVESKKAQAVIIAPTYELASQIARVAKFFSTRPEDIALLIGGVDKKRQEAALKTKPLIVIGTLGRVKEMITAKKLSMHYVKTLVFDEADRLFSSQNMEGIHALVKSTLRDRQILLVSATMPKGTKDIAQGMMKEPALISAGDAMPSTITHLYAIAELRKKTDKLKTLINSRAIPKALVFVNMPYDVERTEKRLNFHNIPTRSLHKETDKMDRKVAIESLNNGKIKALVATDAGSRGLDIEGLTHVINLDIPSRHKDYIHRAGRCGRAGNPGTVISIVTPREADELQKIAKKLGITISPI